MLLSLVVCFVFFLMIRRPPRSTRTDTLFPYTTLFRSGPLRDAYNKAGLVGGQVSRLPIPGLPPITPAPSLAVFADRLAELPLVYEPGTRWRYSVGLDLMGRVIEELGRAACRERECQYVEISVVGVLLKKKTRNE